MRKTAAWLLLVLILSFAPVVRAEDAPASFSSIVDRIMPSVVGIAVVKVEPATEPGEASHLIASSGSGFVIRKGYILSNAHVLDHALVARVVTSTGKTYALDPAKIWADPVADLAVAQIDIDLPSVPWAASAQVKIGDPVFAVGAPYGLRFRGSVTRGIVSGFDRPLAADYPFLQTDAPINPGNSGGPLFNMAGEVVGVNARAIVGADGMGFSIPADLAKEVSDALIRDGKVERPWLGLRFMEGQEAALGWSDWDGPVVTMVEPGGAAESSGIEVGDTLLKLDGQTMRSLDDIAGFLRSVKPGTPVSVTFGSGERESTVKLVLSTRPHDAALYHQGDGLWVGLTAPQVELARRFGRELAYVGADDFNDPWTAHAGKARAVLMTEFYTVARRSWESSRTGDSLTGAEAAKTALGSKGTVSVQIDLPTQWKLEPAALWAEWQDQGGSFRADSVKVVEGAAPGYQRVVVLVRSALIERTGMALVVLHMDEGTDRRFVFDLDAIH